MPVNIPNIGTNLDALMSGIKTGSNLFSNIMRPILDREHQKQKAEQFAQQQKQLESHFQANFGLSKQAASRAAQAAQDAHQIAMNKLDPTFPAKQYEALENYYKSRIKNSGQKNGSVPIPNQASPIPVQEFGEGTSMLYPEGLQDVQKKAQQQSNNPSNLTGPDLELMRKFPALRGFHKKVFGIDPLAAENNALHGPARDAADLAKLKKEVGEDSDVYQNAKSAYDAQIDAKKDLRDLRARTKSGLKPGEKEFFDKETGVPLGKEIPLTAAERQSEEGNILFNELYPYVYKGASPFSGEGSIGRLQKAAANYKTDPKARQLFDDFLLSEKMLAATTVNEASTLKAGRTNRTYNMLKESLEAQDIPRMVKKLVKEYGIPASAQLKAAMRYQKALSEARNKARKGTPATQKLFYNPEMQAQHEAQVNEVTQPATEDKNVIVIDQNGKKFKTTEANASHLPNGWKRG